MTLRIDYLLISPHVIDPMPKMSVVIVHHVAKKAMEKVEAAVGGGIGRFQAKIPLADDPAVVLCRFNISGTNTAFLTDGPDC
jgi:hypothetical protein